MSDKGRPLPKFGEWDVNDPASAEGFTVIFNKARDEKKTGGKPDHLVNPLMVMLSLEEEEEILVNHSLKNGSAACNLRLWTPE
ncbi:hypothetical protein Bca52824_096754 [Brassica carinata]|uniref:RIN4 pathogenic type III effector avirulence factor Avr cleavage site domain-containing protein n=1 Tax=Brassica carinata TaxID=52824 RepID=A0A8X7NZV1_BRACI|nr:hypothetical protein Bca52824_096754 [Brassica carinata]